MSEKTRLTEVDRDKVWLDSRGHRWEWDDINGWCVDGRATHGGFWPDEHGFPPFSEEGAAMSYTYPGGWFGESWNAPVCEPERHKATPVGDDCPECGVKITDIDQGMLIPFVGGGDVQLEAYHLTCFLATILPRRDAIGTDRVCAGCAKPVPRYYCWAGRQDCPVGKPRRDDLKGGWGND